MVTFTARTRCSAGAFDARSPPSVPVSAFSWSAFSWSDFTVVPKPRKWRSRYDCPIISTLVIRTRGLVLAFEGQNVYSDDQATREAPADAKATKCSGAS